MDRLGPRKSAQHKKENENDRHKANAVNQKNAPFDAELTDGGILSHGSVLAFQLVQIGLATDQERKSVDALMHFRASGCGEGDDLAPAQPTARPANKNTQAW